MKYYIIRECGDFSKPSELKDHESEVYERDSRHYITFKFIDAFNEYTELEEEVYESKKDAWKAILKRLDTHIADMQAKRDEMFALALEDNTFVKTNKEFMNWMENYVLSQPQEDFINKRMREVK